MSQSLSTKDFFLSGSPAQFEWILDLYNEAVSLKARNKRPDNPSNMIKQDKWYHEELPKLLAPRANDCHLTHQELVDIMKWQLSRRKYQSRCQSYNSFFLLSLLPRLNKLECLHLPRFSYK
jgi:hypothetical protein